MFIYIHLYAHTVSVMRIYVPKKRQSIAQMHVLFKVTYIIYIFIYKKTLTSK